MYPQSPAGCVTKVSWTTLIARFMRSTWGPSGADRTQVGPMLAPWDLLSGYPKYSLKICVLQKSYIWRWFQTETVCCMCAQRIALGTYTKFQLEIFTINVISGIVYFRKIIWWFRKMLAKQPSDYTTTTKHVHIIWIYVYVHIFIIYIYGTGIRMLNLAHISCMDEWLNFVRAF